MPEAKPEKKKRIRQTALQKELDAFHAMAEILRPLNNEQRERVYKSAIEFLPTIPPAPVHCT
jgi:hypothetical protein